MAHKAVCRAVAGMVLALVSTVVSSGCRVDPATDLVQQVRKALADPNVRWQVQQQNEYLDTLRQSIRQKDHHVPHYSRRIDFLHSSLPPFSASIAGTDCTEAQFHVYKANVRWYIETLISEPLASDTDKDLLKCQFRDLCAYATAHLRGQFPFLYQTSVEEAKIVAMQHFDAQIDAPLLPPFRRPFTEAQLRQIQAHWASAYLRYSSIWQGVQREAFGLEGLSDDREALQQLHYRFVMRCLHNLPQAIWPSIEGVPDYVRQANAVLSKEKAGQSRSYAQIRKTKNDLYDRIEQVEQWGFVFAALLETMNLEQRPMPLSASRP